MKDVSDVYCGGPAAAGDYDRGGERTDSRSASSPNSFLQKYGTTDVSPDVRLGAHHFVGPSLTDVFGKRSHAGDDLPAYSK